MSLPMKILLRLLAPLVLLLWVAPARAQNTAPLLGKGGVITPCVVHLDTGAIENCTTSSSGGGSVNGPVSSVMGYLPTWGNVVGTLLLGGLPVATTSGVNTVIESDGTGKMDSSWLPASGVSTGACGDATHVCVVTLDAAGRVTAASQVVIPGAGTGVVSVTGDSTITCNTVSSAVTCGVNPAAVVSPSANNNMTGNNLITVQSQYVIWPNNATNGTVLNKWACVASDSTARLCDHTTNSKPIGIVFSGAGTTGNATIAINGTQQCVFDAAFNIANFVQLSGSTDGDCTDGGSTFPNGFVGGYAASTSGSPATATINLAMYQSTFASTAGAVTNDASLTIGVPTCGNGGTHITNCGAGAFMLPGSTNTMTSSGSIDSSAQTAPNRVANISGVGALSTATPGQQQYDTASKSMATSGTFIGHTPSAFTCGGALTNTDQISTDGAAYNGSASSQQATSGSTNFQFATTCSIPANTLVAGKALLLQLGFGYNTSASAVPNMQITVKVGGLTVFTSALGGATASLSNRTTGMALKFWGTAAPGASVSMQTDTLYFGYPSSSGNQVSYNGSSPLTTQATNSNLTVSVFAQFSAVSSAGNCISLESFQLQATN